MSPGYDTCAKQPKKRSHTRRGRDRSILDSDEIVGPRDRLIHGYEEVDLDILWTIVTDDLPVLVSELNRTG
jgi:hypothetical protein